MRKRAARFSSPGPSGTLREALDDASSNSSSEAYAAFFARFTAGFLVAGAEDGSFRLGGIWSKTKSEFGFLFDVHAVSTRRTKDEHCSSAPSDGQVIPTRFGAIGRSYCQQRGESRPRERIDRCRRSRGRYEAARSTCRTPRSSTPSIPFISP